MGEGVAGIVFVDCDVGIFDERHLNLLQEIQGHMFIVSARMEDRRASDVLPLIQEFVDLRP